MSLECRAVRKNDLPEIAGFPKDQLELYFFMPKASFPLAIEALEQTIAVRQAPTVVLVDGEVAGFADLYDCEPGEVCRIGNVVVSPKFRGRGGAHANWFSE